MISKGKTILTRTSNNDKSSMMKCKKVLYVANGVKHSLLTRIRTAQLFFAVKVQSCSGPTTDTENIVVFKKFDQFRSR